MSRLAPLDIELTNFESPPSQISSCCSSNSELYIPVHRRKVTSEVSPVPSVASSLSSSPMSIAESDITIYNADDLVLLSQSPLARLLADDRSHLGEAVPKVVMGRKRRTGLEWHNSRSRTKKGTRTSARESRADQAKSWRKSND